MTRSVEEGDALLILALSDNARVGTDGLRDAACLPSSHLAVADKVQQ